MFTSMLSVGENLDDVDIDRTEKQLNIKFPEDYKKFLKEFNAGKPNEKMVNSPYGKANISHFFGLVDNRYYSLIAAMELILDEFPSGLIAIANTPNGDDIILSVREDSYGEIYYLNHEEEDKYEFYNNVGELNKAYSKLADSFSEFLSYLE